MRVPALHDDSHHPGRVPDARDAPGRVSHLQVASSSLTIIYCQHGHYHISRLFLLRNRLETEEITKAQYLKKLATLRPSLAEAVTILSFEPEGSLEASRLTFAEKYLANIDLALKNGHNPVL